MPTFFLGFVSPCLKQVGTDTPSDFVLVTNEPMVAADINESVITAAGRTNAEIASVGAPFTFSLSLCHISL
jgi:hypothetical protein